MNNKASITPLSIIRGPIVKHAQDPERPSHTLCGVPIAEIDQWAGAHCHTTVTCEGCRPRRYAKSSKKEVSVSEKKPLVKTPPRKSFLTLLSRLFGSDNNS